MRRGFNLRAIALRGKQSHDERKRRARNLKRNLCKHSAENELKTRHRELCEMKIFKKYRVKENVKITNKQIKKEKS